jgi:hypothetical protein
MVGAYLGRRPSIRDGERYARTMPSSIVRLDITQKPNREGMMELEDPLNIRCQSSAFSLRVLFHGGLQSPGNPNHERSRFHPCTPLDSNGAESKPSAERS